MCILTTEFQLFVYHANETICIEARMYKFVNIMRKKDLFVFMFLVSSDCPRSPLLYKVSCIDHNTCIYYHVQSTSNLRFSGVVVMLLTHILYYCLLCDRKKRIYGIWVKVTHFEEVTGRSEWLLYSTLQRGVGRRTIFFSNYNLMNARIRHCK